MIINTRPERCIRLAEELKQTESNLNAVSYSIEEVISGLRHSDSESMQIAANRLSGTLESLRRKNRTVCMMHTALERIGALYKKTEDEIRGYEDQTGSRPPKMARQDISGYKPYIENTFSGF